MSDVVERTLASFPWLLASSLIGGSTKSQAGWQSLPSRGLQALLRAVDSAQSHAEEETVIKKELQLLSKKISKPGISASQIRDLFPRIIFCSIIGYDVSFCLIHAVNLAQQGVGLDKRIGYLAATLLLDPDHEMSVLMVGTLQRDLRSANMLNNCLALVTAAHLINAETIPALLPAVLSCLQHRRELVREKAVHCLHSFFLLAPSLLNHSIPRFKDMLSDRDPGVLCALLNLLTSLVQQDPDSFISLGTGLLGVLKQVREHRFPANQEYHGIPLPWLQMNLLKVLGTLGARNALLSSSLVPTFSEILHKVNPKELISLAVAYQCLLAISVLARTSRRREGSKDLDNFRFNSANKDWDSEHISSSEMSRNSCESFVVLKETSFENKPLTGEIIKLLQQASQCVGRFLQSSNYNLRYVGIKSLTQLVAVSPGIAVEHQAAVMRCLDDQDLAVRHQTLFLLQHMANPANVKPICSKLLDQLNQHAPDVMFCSDVSKMVCDIAFALSPDPGWYMETLLPMLSMSLDVQILSGVADSMLAYFMEASQRDNWEFFSHQLFQVAVEIIQAADVSKSYLLQFGIKVLRFIPFGTATITGPCFLQACSQLMKSESLLIEIKEQIVLCVQDNLIRGALDNENVLQWAEKLGVRDNSSFPRKLRQKVIELQNLSSLWQDAGKSFPIPMSKHNLDFTLTFADEYICEVLEGGGQLFKLSALSRSDQEDNRNTLLLGMDNPSNAAAKSTSSSKSSPYGTDIIKDGNIDVSAFSASENTDSQSTNLLQSIPGVKKVWTKQGITLINHKTQSEQFINFSGIQNSQSNSNETSLQKDNVSQNPAVLQREETAKALFQGISPDLLNSQPSCAHPPKILHNTATVSSVLHLVSDQEPIMMHGILHTADSSGCGASNLAMVSNMAVGIDHELNVLPTNDTSGWRKLHESYIGDQPSNLPHLENQNQSPRTEFPTLLVLEMERSAKVTLETRNDPISEEGMLQISKKLPVSSNCPPTPHIDDSDVSCLDVSTSTKNRQDKASANSFQDSSDSRTDLSPTEDSSSSLYSNDSLNEVENRLALSIENSVQLNQQLSSTSVATLTEDVNINAFGEQDNLYTEYLSAPELDYEDTLILEQDRKEDVISMEQIARECLNLSIEFSSVEMDDGAADSSTAWVKEQDPGSEPYLSSSQSS